MAVYWGMARRGAAGWGGAGCGGVVCVGRRGVEMDYGPGDCWTETNMGRCGRGAPRQSPSFFALLSPDPPPPSAITAQMVV